MEKDDVLENNNTIKINIFDNDEFFLKSSKKSFDNKEIDFIKELNLSDASYIKITKRILSNNDIFIFLFFFFESIYFTLYYK